MSDDDAHVLVIDDDTRLRDLLRRFLTENGFRVTTAADAAEARARLSQLEFDLLIVDVMMPGEDGLDLTRDLRRTKAVPILLLTARGTPEDRIAGLEAGGDDYLPKPFEPRELLLRITAILRRARAPVPGDASATRLLRFGVFQFDTARGELRGADGPVRLSPAEVALLTALARAPGQPISREDLSAHDSQTNARTIDVQVTRLRRKIEPDPRMPRFLQTVRGKGYVLRPD